MFVYVCANGLFYVEIIRQKHSYTKPVFVYYDIKWLKIAS